MKHISDPQAANVNIPAQTPSGRLYLAGNQNNINHSVETLVLLDTVDPLFTDGIEDVVNHKITPGVAGWYYYSASVCWETVLDQKRYDMMVLRNAGDICIGRDSYTNSGSGLGTAGQGFNKVSDIIYLTAIQFLELWVNHEDLTNNPDIIGGITRAFLTVQRVR